MCVIRSFVVLLRFFTPVYTIKIANELHPLQEYTLLLIYQARAVCHKK